MGLSFSRSNTVPWILRRIFDEIAQGHHGLIYYLFCYTCFASGSSKEFTCSNSHTAIKNQRKLRCANLGSPCIHTWIFPNAILNLENKTNKMDTQTHGAIGIPALYSPHAPFPIQVAGWQLAPGLVSSGPSMAPVKALGIYGVNHSVAVCAVLPVNATPPVLLAGAYRHYRGTATVRSLSLPQPTCAAAGVCRTYPTTMLRNERQNVAGATDHRQCVLLLHIYGVAARRRIIHSISPTPYSAGVRGQRYFNARLCRWSKFTNKERSRVSLYAS